MTFTRNTELRSNQWPNHKMEPNRSPLVMTSSRHIYEVRPRKGHRGADLIADALPFAFTIWLAM